ncbi:MAG: hypothetical protein ACI959_000407 [Limisphaerales bacterium]|jgi:hypothetical protein
MKLKSIFFNPALICMSFMALVFSCDPYVEAGTELSGDVPTPSFETEFVSDNPNQVIVRATSTGGFQMIWDFGNGTSSTLAVDTVYYPQMGVYDIKLTVSGTGGAAQAVQSVTIAEDDETSCSDEELIRLCGGCSDPDGNLWTWSIAAGAITVGSSPGAGDYFVSAEGALVPEQYDDFYDFIYEDAQYDYLNNGETIFPELGFTPQPYTPNPDAQWSLSPGTGVGGVTQLIISDPELFMGTKDSGPVYDIITLTDTDMYVRSEIRDGSGWFEFHFVIVP